MGPIVDFFREFWRQTLSVLNDIADWVLSVFDRSAGPGPKIAVGLVFLLVVLLIVRKSSRPR